MWELWARSQVSQKPGEPVKPSGTRGRMNNRNQETAKDEGISLKRRLKLRHFCFSLLHPDTLCVRARVKIFMGVGVGLLGWERQHQDKNRARSWCYPCGKKKQNTKKERMMGHFGQLVV